MKAEQASTETTAVLVIAIQGHCLEVWKFVKVVFDGHHLVHGEPNGCPDGVVDGSQFLAASTEGVKGWVEIFLEHRELLRDVLPQHLTDTEMMGGDCAQLEYTAQVEQNIGGQAGKSFFL